MQSAVTDWEEATVCHMGGCQNYGPLLGPLTTRRRTILRTPKKDHNFDNHPYKQS